MTAKIIQLRTDLKPSEARHVELAYNLLKSTTQLSEAQIKCRLFFDRVLNSAGTEFLIVSSISLPQRQLYNIKKRVIEDLLGIIERNKNDETIKHASIRSIALKYGAQPGTQVTSEGRSTKLQLRFTDLLNFFAAYQAEPTLKLICPHSGEPLPSIGINVGPTFGLEPISSDINPDLSLGNNPDKAHMYTAKIVFSPGLGHKLIQFVLQNGHGGVIEPNEEHGGVIENGERSE